MREKLKRPIEIIKKYFELPIHNRTLLNARLGSIGNLLLTVFKFVGGCVAGSGYLCVSALYSCLMGLAMRQYALSEDKRYQQYSPLQLFRFMGIYMLLAGGLYGVYVGRLLIYPEKMKYPLPVGILVALVSFIDIGLAVYCLLKKDANSGNDLLLFGRKLIGLSSGLPAIVMTQIVLNSIVNENDTSWHDGIFGAAIGFVIFGIGIGMILYSWMKERDE